MGFDDDMIEAGFWDGNDYLDYLIDEGDRALQDIYDKQEVFCSKSDEKLAREKEEKAKYLRIIQDEIEHEITIKEWMLKNPHKGKLWYAHCSCSPKLGDDYKDFIEKLGTTNIDSFKWRSLYDLKSEAYSREKKMNNWGKWVEKYEKYEHLKNESREKWDEFKSSIYSEYIRKAFVELFGYDEHGIIFRYNKRGRANGKHIISKKHPILTEWINENKKTWEIILEKHGLKTIDNNKYLYNSWEDSFGWHDLFATFKVMYKEQWEKIKEDAIKQITSRTNEKLKTAWKRNHPKTFDDWFWSNIDLDDDVNEKKLLNSWIEKHPKKYFNWVCRYLWHKNYKEYFIMDGMCGKEYPFFNAWKTIYPKKYEAWINLHYEDWKRMAIDIDVFRNWVFDGNEYLFDKWANLNIKQWKKLKKKAMEEDIEEAYGGIFFWKKNYYEIENWRKNNPKEWKEWKFELEEQILINKFNEELDEK